MAKQKSISDLVIELQKENESLKHLHRLANKFCKQEFGYNIVELHKIIERRNRSTTVNQPGQTLSLSHGKESSIRGATPNQTKA